MVKAWRELLEGRKQLLQTEGENALRQERTRVIQYEAKTVGLTHQKEATYALQ